MPPPSSSSSSSKQQQHAAPLRLAIKCSWSGARLAVPSLSSLSSSSTSTSTSTFANSTDGRDGRDAADAPLTIRSTIHSVLARVSDRLPSQLLECATNHASADGSNGDGSNGDGGIDRMFSGATVVYARTAVPIHHWRTHTLRDLGIDGSDAGGVLLTLHLPTGVPTGVPTGANAGARETRETRETREVREAREGTGAQSAAGAQSGGDGEVGGGGGGAAEPMEVDPAPPSASSTSASTSALAHILSSNFDAATVPCLLTILKLLDNLLTKPTEERVRTINLSNVVIQSKIGGCQGGVDLLESCGFRQTDGRLILSEQNEDVERLVAVRREVEGALLNELRVARNRVPRFPGVVSRPVPVLSSSSSSASTSAVGGKGGTTTFDPYRSHAYNAQAAAVGLGQPGTSTEGSGGGMSRTERELNALKRRQQKLERTMQKLGPDGRAIRAYRPGSGPAPSSGGGSGPISTNASSSGGGGGGSGDGSLLAARMKRLEAERKKREDGPLTTKAMRDLESMKKAKVYAHAALRIGFADGSTVTANFLPSETVGTVVEVIREQCFREEVRDKLNFDLYVAPPRRRLDPARRLDAEGLVPAARVHVSWKVGGSPAEITGSNSKTTSMAGSYLRPELFEQDASEGGNGAAPSAAAFPNAQKLVDEDGGGDRKRPAAASGQPTSAEAREEALMARMLGKKPGLFGGKKSGKSSSSDEKKSGGGKPKWFK